MPVPYCRSSRLRLRIPNISTPIFSFRPLKPYIRISFIQTYHSMSEKDGRKELDHISKYFRVQSHGSKNESSYGLPFRQRAQNHPSPSSFLQRQAATRHNGVRSAGIRRAGWVFPERYMTIMRIQCCDCIHEAFRDTGAHDS